MSRHSNDADRLTSSIEFASLDDRRHSLEQRLEDGYSRIDQAALAGSDIGEWESFWIRLLSEYEDVCRELDEAA